MAEGDTLRTMLAALRRLLKVHARQHRRAAAAPGRRSRRARTAGISVAVRGGLGLVHRLTAGPCPSAHRAVLPTCARDRLQRAEAAGRPRTTRRKIAADRAAKDAAFQARRRSDSRRRSTPSSCRSRTSRSIPTTTCRRSSSRSTSRRSSRCRRRPAPTGRCGASARCEFTLKGQPLTLAAFVEVGSRSRAICSCRSAI